MKTKDNFTKNLFIFCLILVFGSIFGTISANCIGPDIKIYISTNVSNYIGGFLGQKINFLTFLKTAFNIALFPIIMIIFSFSSIERIVTPLAVFLKGYLLSFSVAVFTKVYGMSGILLSLSVFCFSSLFSILAILLLAAGNADFKKKPKLYYLIVGILLIGTALDIFLTPLLVNLTKGLI